MSKQNNMKKKKSTKILCGYLLVIYCWAWSLTLSVVLLPKVVLLEKPNFFLCKWLSVRDSILDRDGSLCLLSPLSNWISS